MTEQLRVLIAFGLGLLLLLHRLDAERFGAAEYDESVGGRSGPPLRRRLAWYVLGVGLIAAVLLIYPGTASPLPLGLGDRLGAIIIGFTYGAIGATQAFAFASLRYGRLGNFPQAFTHLALINAVMHVIHAEQDAVAGAHPEARPRSLAPRTMRDETEPSLSSPRRPWATPGNGHPASEG